MKRTISIAAVMVMLCISVRADDTDRRQVTFSRDVAPIFQNRCQECHRPGQIGPMSLMTHEESRPWAKAIRAAVAERSMPPWPAHSSSLPFKGNISLSDSEIATVLAWVDQGAQAGDPADLPPPREFNDDGWRNGEPQIVLSPSEPWTAPDGPDEYRCFAVPLGLDEEVWVKGVEYQPGNRSVVHHYILFQDHKGMFAAKDAATPEPGIECADMREVLGGTSVLSMWAPGNVTPLAPHGSGKRLGAGNDLILQIHFHNETGAPQTDLSRFALFLAPPDEIIDKEIHRTMVQQTRINIPAGAPYVEHRATMKAMYDLTVFGTGVHMHLRGKDIGMWATTPDGVRHTIVWVPRYDFDWQYTYELEEPFRAPKGTVFEMISHHDNSAANSYNPDPTKDVGFGLMSTDEMAFTSYIFTKDDEKLGIVPSLPKSLKRVSMKD